MNPLGINFLVTFQKGQIVHLQIENTATENMPVVMPPNDQYILTFDNGHVVIGATHENDTGFDHRVTAGGLHEVFHKALTVAPGLENATMLETRVDSDHLHQDSYLLSDRYLTLKEFSLRMD